jgi:hypothetical protein
LQFAVRNVPVAPFWLHFSIVEGRGVTSAHVASVDAVAAFRGALRTFEADAAQAILSLDEQARRALDWLDNEAPAYWRQEIRRCSDLVARTRSELETCKMRTIAGQRAACLEELEAYRAARRKLQSAEEKIEIVRRWAERVRRELDDYRGRTMGLRMALERDLPRTFGLLDRTIASLDAYVEQADDRQAQPSESPPSTEPT